MHLIPPFVFVADECTRSATASAEASSSNSNGNGNGSASASASASSGVESEYEEMTMKEIMLGKKPTFPGLIPLVRTYLDMIKCDDKTLEV